jgi:hypothetical protein
MSVSPFRAMLDQVEARHRDGDYRQPTFGAAARAARTTPPTRVRPLPAQSPAGKKQRPQQVLSPV